MSNVQFFLEMQVPLKVCSQVCLAASIVHTWTYGGCHCLMAVTWTVLFFFHLSGMSTKYVTGEICFEEETFMDLSSGLLAWRHDNL